ncbi:hypothetical protein ACHQM5_016231 [Ranunculus cassubicifolius]
MEVLVALPPSMDFNFDSSCSTPYISAPSSPKLVGEIYFSAPTSPKHAAAFYRNISFIQRRSASFDGSPLVWEDGEETVKSDLIDDAHLDDQQDFAFDFSGHLDTASLTADELFDGGKIKPLKPQQFRISVSRPKSPKWSKKKITEEEQERGRERVSSSSSKPKHRPTRSLSPLKLSEFISQDQEEEQSTKNTTISKSYSFSFFTKWKLKDFLLFRSTSEGRALDNDPLKKYTSMGQKQQEELDSRNSSFRSTGGSSHGGSSNGGSTIRRGSVSAHELHYKSNRAVHDQMKRKTFLPYRKGLLGCIGFNPTVSGIAKGLNSIKRG